MLWLELAKRFGLCVKPDQFAKPPVADMAAELGLVGSRIVQREEAE